MTYSIITLGGTIIKSEMTKAEAEKECKELGSKGYYHIREDKEAKEIENSPTFNDLLSAKETGNEIKNTGTENTNTEKNKEAEKEWDNLQNEGHTDGYNPHRNQ